MASPITRLGAPTPRSTAAVALQSQLTDLHEDRARLAAEVARLERHVSMLSTEVATADQKVADLEKLLQAARRLDALDEEGRTMWPILGVGPTGAACGPLLVSDPLVSPALEMGKCQFAGPRGASELPCSAPLASIPLLSWPHTVGALVVFRLVSHRAALRRVDIDLLEFLSSHAAVALQIADLRSADAQRPPSLL